MKFEIFDQPKSDEKIVKLKLKSTAGGVDVAVVDEDGEVEVYLLKIDANGVSLYSGVDDEYGMARNGSRLKVSNL